MSPASRHLLHVFATFDAGGPQVRTAQILSMLPPGDRHSILAMDGRTGCAARIAPAVRFELLAPPPRAGFLATARAMGRRIAALRPDLLLTYNWGAIESVLGAALARFGAVVHHEEGFQQEEFDRQLRRRVLVRRLLLRRAHRVIVPSLRLAEIGRGAWRQPASRLVHLPNGVDLVRFRPAPRRRREGTVIGCVSAFRPEKNQGLLVRAFAALPDRGAARLVLVGDGPERAGVAALARELGVSGQVTFAGAVADTSSVYADFDIFALSSRTEQMPLVALEAMASGLPVVATDVGDVARMVAAPNRPLVVAPDDPAALAAALARVLAGPALRAELGAANRRVCEQRYELTACLRRYLAVYEEAMA